MHRAVDEAVGLEGAERAGEHALADALDGAVQVVVAVWATAEQDDDEHAPPVAEAAEEVADRARVQLGLGHRAGQFEREHHPGFTRSGLDGHPSRMVRGALKTLARFLARPVAQSVGPIIDWIDHPPTEPLTAVDRGKPVALTLKTLDPAAAHRLKTYTETLLTK